MYNSFQEMIEGENISKDSDMYYFLLAKENKQNRKKRAPKIKSKGRFTKKKEKKEKKKDKEEKIYIFPSKENYRIEIPGIKLYSQEIDYLENKGMHKCGYLREPHWKDEVYHGLCALTNFNLCQYPRIFYRTSQNHCPIEVHFHKEACEKYQRSLKKPAPLLEKKEFYSDQNGNSLQEEQIQKEINNIKKEFSFPVCLEGSLQLPITSDKSIDRTVYK